MANVSETSGLRVPSALSEGFSQKKIPSLDGLRAVSVLLVILNHLQVAYVPDGRGVLTFFVLSGFLITWILLNESSRYGDISIKNFYIRRILRIFPAFYVFWFLHLVAFLAVQRAFPKFAVVDYVSSFFYVSNYHLALSHVAHHSIAHTWALSIEEQFYLLWPLLFAFYQSDFRRFSRFLIGAIVAIDLYRIVLFFGLHVTDAWLNVTFDSRADHLLVGCLLAISLKRGMLPWFWAFVTSRLWLSAVTFGLIIASIALNEHYHLRYKYAVGFVVDPWLTAILMVQVITFGSSTLWGWLNWRVTSYLGRISYSMFLYHGFTNRLAVYLLKGSPKLLVVIAAICLATLCGTISYYAIELRFLRLKSRFPGRRSALVPPQTATQPGSILVSR
jgi:peptidoglycan/LPS O-acetylase OafA/YrhL